MSADYAEGIGTRKVESDLLSKKYARHIRSRIDDYGTIVNTANYGLRMVQTGDKGTTHVSILAPNGDAVAVTSSINLDFGCGKMSNSTGLILNDHMADFSLPNSDTSEEFTPFPNNYIEPGKRPISSMVPAIFTDLSGDVRLVVGASGDDKTVTSVALVCSRYLWLGQGLKEAIDARRVHHQLVPNILYYEQGLLRQQVDGLQHRGHRTRKEKGAWPGVNAVAREGHGAIVANSDFRMNGTIQGF
uniref:Gamma-glutamyltranspeptidase 1 n=1 Tax=Timema tahoe TaxID=61484 RepID=A0A7R9IMB4_9NEOP|nr:unnamed protein product [Timema tahoe]